MGLEPELLGGDDPRLESKLRELDQCQAFVIEVADTSGLHHIQEKASVVAVHDDGAQIYLLRGNNRARNVADRADSPVEGHLDERVSNGRVLHRNRRSRFDRNEQVGGVLDRTFVERGEMLGRGCRER